MSEPVAVPVQPAEPATREAKVRSTQTSDQILDEGFDHESFVGTYGVPFVADYFGIKDLYKTDPTGSVVSMVDEVTDFLLSEAQDQPLVFVLKTMVDQMEQELNLKPTDAGFYKLKQLHRLTTLKQKLAQVEDLKQVALDDIERML